MFSIDMRFSEVKFQGDSHNVVHSSHNLLNNQSYFDMMFAYPIFPFFSLSHGNVAARVFLSFSDNCPPYTTSSVAADLFFVTMINKNKK